MSKETVKQNYSITGLKSRDKFFILFILILIIKLILLGLFSSDYQNKFFIPFVNIFLNIKSNPWEYVWQNNIPIQFPYHPLMLYFYSIGQFFVNLFHISNVFMQNILFKFPTLIADIGIFYLLLKTYKKHYKNILTFYFMSPIIIYASYIHSQLDLVPVALLFLSFYYLKKHKIFQSSIIFGIAACVKMNVILFLPLFIVYSLRNYNKIKAISSVLITAFIYFLISSPYIFSQGYQNLVLMNSKQNLMFNLYIPMGDIKIYVSLFMASLIYLRFFAYKKINPDLFDLYTVLVISLFLLFVPPSTPAWFVWLVPFLSIFTINYAEKSKTILISYWIFNIVYILYFVFLHQGDLGDVTFLSQSINLKITAPFIKNFVFTILEALLTGIIYQIYKFGVRSNALYKKDKAVVVGIGGDSGSGKSTLLSDIQDLLKDDLLIIEGDGDHKWERGDVNWETKTHLNPKANDLYKQIKDLLKLKKLQSIMRRDYNHETGTFNQPKKIEPKPFIILAGLHPFYLPKMRKIMDFKIYLEPEEELRREWKINRDTNLRGYSKEDVIKSMDNRIIDSKKYIYPQKNFSDMVIKYYYVVKNNINALTNSPPRQNKHLGLILN